MSLLDTAAIAAAEGAAASEPSELSEDQFRQRVEGLLEPAAAAEPGAETAAAANSGTEPETGREETPATGEEEGHTEPPATEPAAIEPPRSWSDEDKAIFGKLPPEAQRIIAGREGERDKAFNQKTEEVANERKATTAEREAMQKATAQYAQNLQAAFTMAVPQLEQFKGVDWDKLSVENPAKWAELSQARAGVIQRVEAIGAEMRRVEQEHRQEQEKQHQGYLVEQRKLLVERIPEFADAEKAKALSGELGQFLKSSGYTEAEIGQVADHRAVALAVRLMRFEKAEAARKAAAAKTAPATPPRTQKPGAAPASDQGGTQQIRDLQGRFLKNRDDASMAALIEAML